MAFIIKLVALAALVLMPLGMATGPATASEARATATTGHCDERPKLPAHRRAGMADCSICTALPPATLPSAATDCAPPPPLEAPLVKPIAGIAPEVVPPPPRPS